MLAMCHYIVIILAGNITDKDIYTQAENDMTTVTKLTKACLILHKATHPHAAKYRDLNGCENRIHILRTTQTTLLIQ